MLKHGAVFFARADKLGDPFEGSFPRANEAVREQRWKGRLPDGCMPRGGWKNLFAHIARSARESRRWHLVTCWHLSPHESAGMWILYGGRGSPISIKCSFQRLRERLPGAVHLGCVKYIDYDSVEIPEWNGFVPYMHKRASFSHEREVRGVLWLKAEGPFKRAVPPEVGLWVPVDLHSLIEAVHVAPASPGWFLDLVRDVSGRYGFSFPVRQSQMDGDPFF